MPIAILSMVAGLVLLVALVTFNVKWFSGRAPVKRSERQYPVSPAQEDKQPSQPQPFERPAAEPASGDAAPAADAKRQPEEEASVSPVIELYPYASAEPGEDDPERGNEGAEREAEEAVPMGDEAYRRALLQFKEQPLPDAPTEAGLRGSAEKSVLKDEDFRSVLRAMQRRKDR
ncbi:hypothetical protein O9H85_35325 [Paenibacillus filicis]|uniref:Uncharacterized protein n=1 Tax=Paenibacillus gyeongsangnamensis TaxID=3388067 RepID=A0ABT4QKZ6_9BACL|nr:hypothetical protein [Paenibacillus filicis]MCZ8517520.1 hypothetical protein [Paenibacillus filicis]